MTILAHDCHGEGPAGAPMPINAVRASHLTMMANVVTAGYAQAPDSALETVTNVTSVGNRWQLSTGYFTYHSSALKVAGGLLSAPSMPLKVQAAAECCVAVARDARGGRAPANCVFRQRYRAGAWTDYASLRGSLTSNTAAAVSGRLSAREKIGGVNTEILSYSGEALDHFRDLRTSGYFATTGRRFAALGAPPTATLSIVPIVEPAIRARPATQGRSRSD